MTNHLKKGVVLLTWPIFVCATVDVEKFRHRTLLAGINKIDDGPPGCLSHLRWSTL